MNLDTKVGGAGEAGGELERLATEITFSTSFWGNRPQSCRLNLEEKLKCLEGVIKGKVKTSQHSVIKRVRGWEEGFAGENSLRLRTEEVK